MKRFINAKRLTCKNWKSWLLKVRQICFMAMNLVLAAKDTFLMGVGPPMRQFPDEKVAIYVEKGYKVNVFGLISRTNQCHWAMTQQNIDSQFVVNHLDNLSLKITKETFIVLDNASIHQSKLLRENLDAWQKRVGPPMRAFHLFLAYLFTTSKHCRNDVAKVKNRVVISRRLSRKRQPFLRCKQMYG